MASESVYARINRVLSWKKIVTFNVFLLLVVVTPLSVSLVQEDTETRTGAAGELAAPSPEPPANYPKDSPEIERVRTFFGKTGDTVVLLGDDFGDYQWKSLVYVGGVQTTEDDIVRWSNRVVEVQIPAAARTGKVWVVVNGKRADWEGSLLLYDVNQSVQMGMEREADKVSLWLEKGEEIASGMVELGYTPISLDVEGGSGIEITSETQSSDGLGKKMRVEFTAKSQLKRVRTEILNLYVGGGGSVEITRAEFYDFTGKLIEVYADPLGSSVAL